jgi:hypothetical protein
MTEILRAPAPRAVAQPQGAIHVEIPFQEQIKVARFRLQTEWKWIIARSWSLRFVFLAFIFSALEVTLPLVSSAQGLPFYPILIGLTTGAAFVARLFAQNKD